MSGNNKNQQQKTPKDHKSFKEKLEDESPMDDIPDEDLKKEEREIKKGHQSKNDSSSEEQYDEDFRSNANINQSKR